MPDAVAFDSKLFQASFEKRFGKDVLVDFKKQPAKGAPGTFVSTGSFSLDLALGIGGLPLGRVVELFGPESSGKSTLALHVLLELQRMFPKKPVGYLDVECAMNREYAEMIGLDLDPKRFFFIQESQTDKVLDMAHEMAKAGFSGVVIDSVAGLISKEELEDQETTHSKMGGNSKAMSSHLRFMTNTISQTNTLVLYLNQIREKLGVMFGDPETTSGGRALRFYATIRIRTAITGKIKGKGGEEIIGANIGVKVPKNKVAAPHKTAKYDLLYGKGIDRWGDLVDVCLDTGLLTKNGSWVQYNGENIGQGRNAAVERVRDDAKFAKLLTDTLWSRA